MPLDKTPDDYLEMTEDELKRRKEAFEAYKLQQEVQETLKWKWIAKLGSSLGVVTMSKTRRVANGTRRRLSNTVGIATL